MGLTTFIGSTPSGGVGSSTGVGIGEAALDLTLGSSKPRSLGVKSVEEENENIPAESCEEDNSSTSGVVAIGVVSPKTLEAHREADEDFFFFFFVDDPEPTSTSAVVVIGVVSPKTLEAHLEADEDFFFSFS